MSSNLLNRKLVPILGLAFGALFVSCRSSNTESSEQVAPAIDLSAIDTTVRPQDDFYLYANGQWLKDNPLKPAYSRYGTFNILQDSSEAQIRRIIDDLSSNKQEKGTEEYKIATLYRQAMDSLTRNAQGIEPLHADLRAISDVENKDELLALVAKLDHEFGAGVFFSSYVFTDQKNSDVNIFHLGQKSLELGPKDYYLEEGESMQDIRAKYVQYLERILTLAGYDAQQASKMAQTTLKMETALAKISYSYTELRDNKLNYNLLDLKTFASENEGFPWMKYFSLRGLELKEVNFAQLKFLKAFSKWYQDTPLEDMKAYLETSAISSASTSLSDEFEKAHFDFFKGTMEGAKEMHPRWKRSLSIVSNVLGEAIGKSYVKEHFSPQSKERMLTLVGNLRKALGERIASLEWMGAETKAKAQEKLESFVVKIGYPDKWKDYSGLDIKEENSYYENLKSAARFAQAENLADLGKPVDRTLWLMNPQDVNAYYMPTTNEICFPAAILQPPFFNKDADDAVNYGAIGVVIGHEMIHGFDDSGSEYDKDGNMNNWWTQEDRTKFEAATARLVEQFAANEVAPGLFANGELTLGENIADQGGLTIAYLALKLVNGLEAKPIDNMTPEQRFFVAYARLWGGHISQEAILQLTKSDPHSLGVLRVNQALKNIDAFFSAFDIKDGDRMWNAPENRIVVW